jgi:hypothetical protein
VRFAGVRPGLTWVGSNHVVTRTIPNPPSSKLRNAANGLYRRDDMKYGVTEYLQLQMNRSRGERRPRGRRAHQFGAMFFRSLAPSNSILPDRDCEDAVCDNTHDIKIEWFLKLTEVYYYSLSR